MAMLLSGCEGRTLVDDNPVFAAAPPRRSLVNESTLAATEPSSVSLVARDIQLTSSGSSTPVLEGNTVVAEVNGKPVFVDDLIGSARLAMEADPRLTDPQRQQIMADEVRRRLPAHIEQEIVLQALNRKIPEDRRKSIREAMEPDFEKLIESIMQERQLLTDEQLNNALAEQGLSIPLLKESFFRAQMVRGFVDTLADDNIPKTIDRGELVRYYQQHKDEYTPQERIRWQEIVVRFNGNRQQAQQKMAEVVNQLNAGADFGKLAVKYSESLSAKTQGDMGWLQKGSLTDDEVEAMLFEQPPGGMTKVFVRDDRFEVFRVAEHQYAHTIPFEEVQQEIEQLLKQRATEDARRKVISDLREKATIETIFDNAV
ncbi:MAG: peptidyl-prolyl cis-trans isomerase [Planctomycetaceae bacterium]